MGVALATAWVAGAIGFNNPIAPLWRYGHYSMNVLSPFVPPRERLPEFLVQLVTWDSGGRTWDANGGQYEGYNYLGAGILLLIVIHLAVSWRIVGTVTKRHAFLILLLIGYILYAISNRLFIGDWFAFEVQLPDLLAKITGHFRTGGRFSGRFTTFWSSRWCGRPRNDFVPESRVR